MGGELDRRARDPAAESRSSRMGKERGREDRGRQESQEEVRVIRRQEEEEEKEKEEEGREEREGRKGLSRATKGRRSGHGQETPDQSIPRNWVRSRPKEEEKIGTQSEAGPSEEQGYKFVNREFVFKQPVRGRRGDPAPRSEPGPQDRHASTRFAGLRVHTAHETLPDSGDGIGMGERHRQPPPASLPVRQSVHPAQDEWRRFSGVPDPLLDRRFIDLGKGRRSTGYDNPAPKIGGAHHLGHTLDDFSKARAGTPRGGFNGVKARGAGCAKGGTARPSCEGKQLLVRERTTQGQREREGERKGEGPRKRQRLGEQEERIEDARYEAEEYETPRGVEEQEKERNLLRVGEEGTEDQRHRETRERAAEAKRKRGKKMIEKQLVGVRGLVLVAKKILRQEKRQEERRHEKATSTERQGGKPLPSLAFHPPAVAATAVGSFSFGEADHGRSQADCAVDQGMGLAEPAKNLVDSASDAVSVGGILTWLDTRVDAILGERCKTLTTGRVFPLPTSPCVISHLFPKIRLRREGFCDVFCFRSIP